MKKILSIIVLIVLILNAFVFNTISETKQKNINVLIDGIYVGGNNGKPFVEDNRTFVPVRAITEKMGAQVFWDNDTRTVSISKLNEKITYNDKEYFNCTTGTKLVIDKKTITISLTDENGVEVFSVEREMDVSAKIVDGRTYIPARFVGYALGYDVLWEDKPDLASKVIYKFTGKQTIDFGADSENFYDPVKRIDYEYDKEKYPDTIVMNDIEYPCRKGYGDVIIVDATNGRFEGTKMINVFPYRWTSNNIIIECDDDKYKIDESKTYLENFETYSKFYTDKVGEKVENNGNVYYPEFVLVESCGMFGLMEGAGKHITSALWGYDYIDRSKDYYFVVNRAPVVDSSKMYYINEKPPVNVGGKIYGSTQPNDSVAMRGINKNTLLFLNEFLGETGHRIWTMMNDYYTMSGYCYVEPETEWTKKYLFVDQWDDISFHLPETLDGIPTETVEKYGLTVVDNRRIDSFTELLTLKTDKQIIYIEYRPINLMLSVGSGYYVLFETIEN